jgi:hypothetical protein
LAWPVIFLIIAAGIPNPLGIQLQGPVLVATEPWEEQAVDEPTVLRDGDGYRMFYSGGFWNCFMGEAKSRDGVHWRKSHGPVLGHGAGGEAANACHSNVMVHDGTYYAYYSAADARHPAYELRYATSDDGIHWTARGTALDVTPAEFMNANTFVWSETAGPGNEYWYMLYESMEFDGEWRIKLATGESPVAWHKIPMSFSDLSVGKTPKTYGGPWLVGDRYAGYTMYYHGGPTGILPTYIYRSTSSDLVHWSGPQQVLILSQAWEFDQVADPSVVGNLMWFSGMNNSAPSGAIGLALLPRV